MRFFAIVLLSACASAQYHYDKAPAPTWIEAVPVKANQGIAQVVGIVPASTDKRGDEERAFDAAKKRLAESLVSEVRSQSNDWSWSKQQGKDTREQTVVEQSVDVRTDIKLEGVTQVASYRDEPSASQYVLARVDFAANARTLSARLRQGIDDLTRSLSEATAMQQDRTAQAFLALQKLRTNAQVLIDDAQLLGVLNARDPALDAYRTLLRQIDDTQKAVAAKATFSISASGPDKAVNDRLVAAARDVFQKWGFSETQGKDPALRLAFAIDSKPAGVEDHGGRKEYTYAATGSARLQQRAGEWNALSTALPDGRYSESHANEDEAKRRALSNGADTLLSIWRSLGRSLAEK